MFIQLNRNFIRWCLVLVLHLFGPADVISNEQLVKDGYSVLSDFMYDTPELTHWSAEQIRHQTRSYAHSCKSYRPITLNKSLQTVVGTCNQS
jgi:hypothetical protein